MLSRALSSGMKRCNIWCSICDNVSDDPAACIIRIDEWYKFISQNIVISHRSFIHSFTP